MGFWRWIALRISARCAHAKSLRRDIGRRVPTALKQSLREKRTRAVGSKMRINPEKENSRGVRTRPAARAQAIEKEPQGIGADKNRGGLDSVAGLALHGNDGKDREKNE